MKIICIGRNYVSHAEELHRDLGLERAGDEPVWFMKPDTALLRNNEPFYIPPFSGQVDYEAELVVKICRVGKCIDRRFAHRYYDEVGLGIDFTARDLQRKAIAGGLPWEASKAFDHSAAVSPEFIPLSEIGGSVEALRFEMSLNGSVRQSCCCADMIFDVDTIISHVSRFVTLKIGDYIFTGTPSGVGPVNIGDRITASLEGRTLLDFNVK